MKAIPMKGRLGSKRLKGYIWAGPGRSWAKKENYFQLEHEEIVSACFQGPSGTFWVRFDGGSCEITGKRNGRTLSTTAITIPRTRT